MQKYQSIRIRNNNCMHYLVQSHSRINCEKIAHLYPLGTFLTFHYTCMFYTFLSGYNARTIQHIKFEFSGFLSLVEATNYVKFQSARCTGFKVDIFRISSTYCQAYIFGYFVFYFRCPISTNKENNTFPQESSSPELYHKITEDKTVWITSS